ncbi:MAG TPA: PspC domain-containing protein [Gemmatimonadaceae bacterium]|nr:PspC domain-containing protein [Gemmatimonadaceae bacterium]
MSAMPSPPPSPVARPSAPQPRLWRSATNRVVLGVIGGIAEKLGWEAKPLRILTGLLGLLTLPIGALPVLVPYLTIWAITRTRGAKRPSLPLRRSATNQVIAGVLGGVGEWLGVKPNIVRVGYSALTVATFGLPGIVTYLIMWSKLRVGRE